MAIEIAVEIVLKHIPLSNRYLSLGDEFYEKTYPKPVANPALIKFNHALAADMDLVFDESNAVDIATVFSGNAIPHTAEPLAMAYAGHQFGHFNPQLGDGRAIYLGEVNHPNGRSFDMQLKGSGRTRYSRNGDGRSALGPVLREYLVSEAMYKLNVPTTRALAAVSSGEEVAREQLSPGGVFTRIASSFVRVGTFQFFSARGDIAAIQKLADYVIERNYPFVNESTHPYRDFLQAVVDKQAALIAQWMQIGFIHGVMNTDNMSIAGETIDYGPCAFMDSFDHNQVYSSIDREGRYAYSNQPSIGLWNLTRLAESMVPLLSDDTDEAVKIAIDTLKTFDERYQTEWLSGMRSKCGLTAKVDDENLDTTQQEDIALIEALLEAMDENQADFTLTFFYLSQLSAESAEHDNEVRKLFNEPAQFDAWVIKWRQRLQQQTQSDKERQKNMQAVNPVYIPRNHLIEAAIRAAEDHNDFSSFHELHEVLQTPFKQQACKEKFMLPPEPDEVVEYTFCGT